MHLFQAFLTRILGVSGLGVSQVALWIGFVDSARNELLERTCSTTMLREYSQRKKVISLQGLTRSHMVSQIWGLKATDTSSSRPSVRTWVPRLTMASPKETSVLTSHEFARHVQTQGSALLNPIKTYWDNQVPHYSCASVLTRGHHLKPKTISKTDIAAGTFLQYLRTMKSLHQNAPNVTAEVVKDLAQLL